jgi:hypothetical protein
MVLLRGQRTVLHAGSSIETLPDGAVEIPIDGNTIFHKQITQKRCGKRRGVRFHLAKEAKAATMVIVSAPSASSCGSCKQEEADQTSATVSVSWPSLTLRRQVAYLADVLDTRVDLPLILLIGHGCLDASACASSPSRASGMMTAALASAAPYTWDTRADCSTATGSACDQSRGHGRLPHQQGERGGHGARQHGDAYSKCSTRGYHHRGPGHRKKSVQQWRDSGSPGQRADRVLTGRGS